MGFQDALKKSFLEGFAANDMPMSQILTVLGITFLIGVYIFVIYKLVNRTAMYDKSYHVAMSVICVITAGIILAMQSSIVISLGMVGALSIVRFRTAVKDTMDLLFLFWSIGEGIICGAGLFELAVVVALVVTAGVFILEYLPFNKKPYILVVNSNDPEDEEKIKGSVDSLCKGSKIRSRNIKKSGLDMILEVYTDKEAELLKDLNGIPSVENASLLTHEGEVRF
ncbi:MAG: DUF4956 domain-containing protein [Lachnospiraceae bacterium]|nr:DUF4956 domain-containing protein [Lachnospiraceae bacterium]